MIEAAFLSASVTLWSTTLQANKPITFSVSEGNITYERRYDVRYRSSVAYKLPPLCGLFLVYITIYALTYRIYATAYLIRFAIVTGVHAILG
jgi:hypothetical protein